MRGRARLCRLGLGRGLRVMAKIGVNMIPEGVTVRDLYAGRWRPLPGKNISQGERCDYDRCDQVFQAVRDAHECDFCNGLFCACHADHRIHGCLTGRTDTRYKPDKPLDKFRV